MLDETRMFLSSPEGLSELERMVRRDRNHPSVIIWSIANEERQQGTERDARIGASMKRLVRSLDPTRPITSAMNGGWCLGVVSQEVVVIESCSADGWLLVEAGVGTMPVVLMGPEGQPGGSVL